MAKFNGNRARLALFGSFAVYLVPIYSVHVSLPLGAILWTAVISGYGGRNPVWIAAILGLAIVLQCIAGALIYWLLRALRWVRVLVLLAGCVGIFAVVQFGYLVAIPWALLTEREKSAEVGDWPIVCSVANAEIAESRSLSAALQRSSEVWLIVDGDHYGLLTMPDCRMRKLPISTFRTTIDQMIPQGRALFRASEQNGGPERQFVLDLDGKVLPLQKPKDLTHWRPVLADDGTAIAWMENKRVSGETGARWIARIRELPSMSERTIDLQMDRPASIEILAFDPQAGRIVARRNGREIVTINNAGRISVDANMPDSENQPTQRMFELGNGWVSWDVYRDEGRHRVAWSLPAGNGHHEVPLGRGVRHVTASPDGQLIAVSVGPNVRVGSIRDAVYVLRADNGEDVYRRYFQPHRRSLPAFLGTEFLAITVMDGRLPRVDVLNILAEFQ